MYIMIEVVLFCLLRVTKTTLELHWPRTGTRFLDLVPICSTRHTKTFATFVLFSNNISDLGEKMARPL